MAILPSSDRTPCHEAQSPRAVSESSSSRFPILHPRKARSRRRRRHEPQRLGWRKRAPYPRRTSRLDQRTSPTTTTTITTDVCPSRIRNRCPIFPDIDTEPVKKIRRKHAAPCNEQRFPPPRNARTRWPFGSIRGALIYDMCDGDGDAICIIAQRSLSDHAARVRP